MVLCSTFVRQSRVWGRTGLRVSLERSPLATALRCSIFRPTAELAARFALRSNSCGESVNEARKRAAENSALLGAPEAPANRCAPTRDFAEIVLAPSRWHAHSRFATGGARRGRSLRRREAQTQGRRAARASLTSSPWLSERSAQRVASSTARPCDEHRSGVGAKRQPPQCEPPPRTTCREAANRRNRPDKAIAPAQSTAHPTAKTRVVHCLRKSDADHRHSTA